MTTQKFDIHKAALVAAENLAARVERIYDYQVLCITGSQVLAKTQAQAADVESAIAAEVAFNPEFKNDTQRKAAVVQLKANNPDLQNIKDAIAEQETQNALNRLEVEALKQAQQADRAIIDLSVALLGSI